MVRRVVAVGLVGTLGAVILSGASRVPEVLARPADVLAAGALRGCSGYCVVCLSGPGHAADAAPPGCGEACNNKDAGEGSGWHTFCAGWDDCFDHQCDQFTSGEERALSTADLFAQVTDAVRHENGDVLAVLLDENPERFHYSAERAAVQITACDGQVIAHYPLTPKVVTQLAH